MTGTTETALFGLAGVAWASAKDVWVRVRTDRFESARLALEQRRFEAEERRQAEERERLRTESEAVGEKHGIVEASEGWTEIMTEELRVVRRERDDARSDLSMLRTALDGVVGALIADIRRLQARNDMLEQRRKRREASANAEDRTGRDVYHGQGERRPE